MAAAAAAAAEAEEAGTVGRAVGGDLLLPPSTRFLYI